MTYVAVRFGHTGPPTGYMQPAVHVTDVEANAQNWLGDAAGQIFQFDGSAPMNLRFTVHDNVITKVN